MPRLLRAKRHGIFWALLGILLLGPQGRALCAEPGTFSGHSLYDFGLHLFRLGDYYRAITELKRFSLFFPDHQQRPAAQVLIGLALQEDGLYEDALAHFDRLQYQEGHTDLQRLAVFKLGELHFQQEQYHQAVDHWQRFVRLYPEGPLVSQTLYLLGLAAALDGQTAYAQRVLAAVPPGDPLRSQSVALQRSLEQPPVASSKSPLTASVLAGILPGAGHLYLGKPVQALTAFLLNGAFLAGAALAFYEHLEVVGGILLYFEAGWYLGNIRSAAEGARETQHLLQQTAVQSLRTAYALPVLTFDRLQTPGIGLRLHF